jgi:hypothetical protein
MISSASWSSCGKSEVWARNFIGEAIMARLLTYVRIHLRLDKAMLSKRNDMPLLSFALDHRYSSSHDLTFVSEDMVNLLLQYRADPNERWRSTTVFHQVSSWFVHEVKNKEISSKPQIAVWAPVFMALLKQGAGSISSYTGAQGLLSSIMPKIIAIFDMYHPSAIPNLRRAWDERLKQRPNNADMHIIKHVIDDTEPRWQARDYKRVRRW